MPTSRLNMTLDVGGLSIKRIATQTEEGQIAAETTLAAAKPGQLTTRTDNDTGTLTMESGHGIQTADTIDIYWAGGMRYGVTVGTVAGLSVPFDLGAGANLPTNLTLVTVQVRTVIAAAFEGDDIAALAASFTKGHRGSVDFYDAGGLEFHCEIAEDGTPLIWADDMPYTNPITGDSIVAVHVTHADTSESCDFQMGVTYNAL